ncbi:MAG TPA: GNAT family N-acetyltransferase [Chitinophagaceae bacterium]|nr:GNAT family N-acetyltransferase [Chitinophagaceae bacterium]
MIRVREAVEADLPEMLVIYNDIIRHTTAVYHYEPQSAESRQAWFKDKQAQGFPVFVAEEAGRVIGFSTFGPFRAWAAYQYTMENSVYVSADARGRGIGKKLMVPLIEAARNRGIHTLVAGIDAGNEVSIRLHQQFGFREVAHFREVGWKFGRWLDLKFLQLLLTEGGTPPVAPSVTGTGRQTG